MFRRLQQALTKPSASTASWPPNWRDMEIESKWKVAREEDFVQFMEAFPHGAVVKLGEASYKARVRWGGAPRLFIDSYRDWEGKPLSNNAHSLRARTRFHSDPSVRTATDVDALNKAHWFEDWQRVQYKSTPVRYGAVWFRLERGNCKTRDDNDGGLCYNTGAKHIMRGNIESGPLAKHPARAKLEEDHPNLPDKYPQEVLLVRDYRYRVVLCSVDEDKDIFEISCDRVFSTTPGQAPVPSFEAELEALPSEDGDRLTEAQIKALFLATEALEGRFPFLQPSDTAKGGIHIPDSTLGGTA